MKPLFIIGYMGCGKTTFGRALSQATGLRFIDLDEYIEQRQNSSVKDIFRDHGEEGFRRIERDMLLEVCRMQDCIVSCGGGTPCFFDNISIINRFGNSLWLKASEEVLFSRLIRKRDKRPLLAGRSDDEIRSIISSQLQARSPFYSRASFSWQGDSLEDARQISDNISEFLNDLYPQIS